MTDVVSGVVVKEGRLQLDMVTRFHPIRQLKKKKKKLFNVGNIGIFYSRGQAKSTNKNGNPLMAEKVTGKRADMLREASGQISAKSHEPLWRKCPYKEIIPEILASTPKSARKNMKNSAIASFHGEQSAHQFSKQVIGPFSRKKMLNIDLNQRFDVTSR